MNKMIGIMLVITLALSVVMAGCSAPSTPPESDGELSTYQLEIDLLGAKDEFLVDGQGRLQSEMEVLSADGSIGLSADKGTILLDVGGKPLQFIRMVVDSSPPPLPEGISVVGSAYDLAPEKATFDPWLELVLRYDPDKLPEDIGEDALYVAYHDGSEWRRLRYKRVDAEAHTITTQVDHFTRFALLAARGSTPPIPLAPKRGTQVGDLAPNFRLTALDGESVSLGNLLGTPVMVNFWATWCGPCRVEMPHIQKLFEDQGWSDRRLVILAIDIGESPEKVADFLDSSGYTFPVLLDASKDVAREYNVRGIPSTFFVDGDGIIRAIKVGAFSSKEEIERNLSKIVP